jgi:serine phosphatase RsbU (regulator of sigma subunit)
MDLVRETAARLNCVVGLLADLQGPKIRVAKFKQGKIELKKGDTIYMFSDGYADQFGGEKNKKLMIKNFKNNLSEISNYPMDKQKALLNKTFEDWRGNNEQVDDVLVMGIKIE